MSDVLFARWQMGMSLGFHIIFAAVGIAMPLLMVLAELRWRRTGDDEYLTLARRWARGTAVLFAVGAVSGTVLSFELGLLFPRFMQLAGPLIGMPFSLEGFAFFTEAIFLGLYLYGWERLRPSLHILAGVLVAVSGLASAVFVTIVNAWMNAPTGFRLEGGALVDIDPVAAMATPYAPHEVVHTALAAYMATALAVAGIHAWALLREPTSGLHRKALTLALALAVPASIAQPIVGHWSGQAVATHQPLKLAAMEAHLETEAGAALRLGPLEIPGGLAWLATGDPDATVVGLSDFPREDWPHPVVHLAFLGMVALGSAAALFSLLVVIRWLRRRQVADSRRLLVATVALAPAGVVAMELGWIVTEVGRQPWVVHGVQRTVDSVTPMPGLIVPLVVFSLVYLGLGAVVVAVLWRQVRTTLGGVAR